MRVEHFFGFAGQITNQACPLPICPLVQSGPCPLVQDEDKGRGSLGECPCGVARLVHGGREAPGVGRDKKHEDEG